MTALITGVSGFVGPHLAYCLRAAGDRVIGLGRGSAPAGLDGFVRADLRDAAAVRSAIAESRPDVIYHLAAQSAVQQSWEDPTGTIINNVVGQINLLEAVMHEQLNPVIVIAVSSEVYGRVPPEEQPVTEQSLLRPLSPYAVSKASQDLSAYQYAAARGLRTIRMRTFNHIGPGQSDRFAVASFARQLIEIERGERPPVITVGNLTSERDFCDVRDIVRAYALAATACTPGEAYNVGSGEPRSMRGVLDMLIGLANIPVTVRDDPARWRPADVPRMVCNSQRFIEASGWQRAVSFEQSLRDVLDDWRQRLALQETPRVQ